jgi:hypothetical protein
MTDLATGDETILEADHGPGALHGTMRRTIMTIKMMLRRSLVLRRSLMLRRSLKDASARRMYIDHHCVTGGEKTMLGVDTVGGT